MQPLTLIIALAIFSKSSALKCWICNSARDPRCGDPFNPATIELTDCDQFMPGRNSTVCRKNVQKVALGTREDLRVVRTCGYEPDNLKKDDFQMQKDAEERGEEDSEEKEVPLITPRCITRAGTFEVMVTYCSCFGEGCNKGVTMESSVIFVLFSVLLAQM